MNTNDLLDKYPLFVLDYTQPDTSWTGTYMQIGLKHSLKGDNYHNYNIMHEIAHIVETPIASVLKPNLGMPLLNTAWSPTIENRRASGFKELRTICWQKVSNICDVEFPCDYTFIYSLIVSYDILINEFEDYCFEFYNKPHANKEGFFKRLDERYFLMKLKLSQQNLIGV